VLAFGDAGYQGIEKRPDAKDNVNWRVAMRSGRRRALDKDKKADAAIDKAEKLKAGVRAKVKHPFRVIKRQFGYAKVRYRGRKKNTAQLITLFALSNLWIGAWKMDVRSSMGALVNRQTALKSASAAQLGCKRGSISAQIALKYCNRTIMTRYFIWRRVIQTILKS
jgi:hypothetical protein